MSEVDVLQIGEESFNTANLLQFNFQPTGLYSLLQVLIDKINQTQKENVSLKDSTKFCNYF